jgi:hypothetical protein
MIFDVMQTFFHIQTGIFNSNAVVKFVRVSYNFKDTSQPREQLGRVGSKLIFSLEDSGSNLRDEEK